MDDTDTDEVEQGLFGDTTGDEVLRGLLSVVKQEEISLDDNGTKREFGGSLFGVPLRGRWFLQCPLRSGRQSMQILPDLLQEQFRQLPLPLHRQQIGIIEEV